MKNPQNTNYECGLNNKQIRKNNEKLVRHKNLVILDHASVDLWNANYHRLVLGNGVGLLGRSAPEQDTVESTCSGRSAPRLDTAADPLLGGRSAPLLDTTAEASHDNRSAPRLDTIAGHHDNRSAPRLDTIAGHHPYFGLEKTHRARFDPAGLIPGERFFACGVRKFYA
jgi:hypothetical protein